MQSLRLLYTGHNFSKSIFVFSLASILMLDIELTLSLSLLMCAKQLGHLHSWVGRLQLSLPINSVVSFGDDVRVSLYFTCRRLVTQQQNSPTLLVYIQYRQLKCIYYYYKKRKRNRYWYICQQLNVIPYIHFPIGPAAAVAMEYRPKQSICIYLYIYIHFFLFLLYSKYSLGRRQCSPPPSCFFFWTRGGIRRLDITTHSSL